MLHKELSERVIGAAIEVHSALGPGLLESAYEQCLCHELALREIRFERQVGCPVEYKGVQLACGYRVDLLVEDTIILELKAVKKVTPTDEAQLLTYLKLREKRLGLIINFNVTRLVDGLTRRVR